MKKVLTIAGSDCSGGAGIQADLKTMTAHKVYGMSVITALTAQNTTGVQGIFDASPDFIELQIDSVFQDIRPDAVKIGMVSSVDTIKSIAKKLKEYDAKHIVVDPVMVSTSGSRLLSPDAITTLKEELFPLAEVITPNMAEAAVLCNFKVENKEEMLKAGLLISKESGVAVLIKGGHLLDSADDLLCNSKGETFWFLSPHIDNPNIHGTGCTLSTAIACSLANGLSMEESIAKAKLYIKGAIESGLDIGSGRGPLNHGYAISTSLD
ncbi:MAG: bifunctional hydroxymethylpyrimidine kinase/phosphomethylpyrimidine kinase [Synergistaceae bacterium]|nr:bifunctional hydroxymethylpyrimidine kinase/phosphomethylpyrimidine kinase [Synergistaceae bacterium]